MYFNSNLFLAQAYLTSILVIHSQSYLLLAANIGDFKSIAKQFLPEKLANQLAALASKTNAPKTTAEPIYDDIFISDTEEESGVQKSETPSIVRTKDETPMSQFNFEDLVEKVKERIKKEMLQTTAVTKLVRNEEEPGQEQLKIASDFKSKYLKDNPNPNYEYYDDTPSTISETVATQRPQKHEFTRQMKKQPVRMVREKINQYREDNKAQNPDEEVIINQETQPETNKDIVNDKDDMTFSRVEILHKNDSYEDYIIPAKEENIFESDEPGEKKMRLVTFSPVDFFTETEKMVTRTTPIPTETIKEEAVDVREYIIGDEDEGSRAKTEELRGVTEDLWYDDKAMNYTEDYVNTTPDEIRDEEITPSSSFLEGLKKTTTTKKKQGTMIPKRDFYKMSSPNYAAKVPVVAEKYDFDEPIPEKDREPENLKPLPMLPAVINGKVKLK